MASSFPGGWKRAARGGHVEHRVAGRPRVGLLGRSTGELDQYDRPGGDVDGGQTIDGLVIDLRQERLGDGIQAVGRGLSLGQLHGGHGQASGIGIGGGPRYELCNGPILDGLTAEIAHDRRVTELAPAEGAHTVDVAPYVEGCVGIAGRPFGLLADEVGLELQAGETIHEMAGFRHPITDDLHVVVGGQVDGVLHGVHVVCSRADA